METMQWLMPIITAALVLIMFSMGVGMVPADFRRIFTQPRAVLAGMLGQLLLLPALGLLFVSMLPLPASILLGLVVVAGCPGGSLSNLISHVGRLDAALSVSLTAVSTVLAAFTLPLWMKAGWQLLGSQSDLPNMDIGPTIIQVLLTTVLPVFAGLLFGQKFPYWASMVDKRGRQFAIGFLVIVVSGTLLKDPTVLMLYWKDLLPLTIGFNALTLLLGLVMGYAARLASWKRLTLMVETGIQNIPLALSLTLGLTASIDSIVVPTLYGVSMMGTGALLLLWLGWWRARQNALRRG